jgi:tripartite-type tricarboxylate transporter receptor subunit TctC
VGWFIAFAVGYFVGARAGRKQFDEVAEAFEAVRSSEEVAELRRAAQSHLGYTLRELAAYVEGQRGDDGDPEAPEIDLVTRVKNLFPRER